MTKGIYLDSNVLIAHFCPDGTEETKRQAVADALSVFGRLKDVQLCTSMWSLTEMVNVLLSRKKIDRSKVFEIENRLLTQRRIGKLRVTLLNPSPRKDYDVNEFFFDVRQGIVSFHSGVGDIIHSVIMKNNKIRRILTFDEKDDFKQIPNLTVMHPRDIII